MIKNLQRALYVACAFLIAGVLFSALDGIAQTIQYSDFNNDGYSDLAIGVPGEDIDGLFSAGAVNVIYGSQSGLDPIETNDHLGDQLFHQDSGEIKGVAQGNDYFGSSVAAGDFNGDNYSDLAIGVPGESIAGKSDAGAINVIYGSFRGLDPKYLHATSIGPSHPENQLLHQDSEEIKGDAEEGDFFGAVLVAGNFNADRYSDLAIGIPGEGIHGFRRAGAVSIIYGSYSGLAPNERSPYPGNQLFHGDTETIHGKAEENNRFGYALATGDLNNDGYSDLAIGEPGETITVYTSETQRPTSRIEAGAIHIIYGSAQGLNPSDSAPNLADQLFHQASDEVKGSAQAGDLFGSALSAGDFNADGYADLAIGVPGESIDGKSAAGAINVIYGSQRGLDPTETDDHLGDQLFHQDSDAINGTAEKNDLFGSSMVAGYFNGDEYCDLAIGVPGESIGDISSAGAVVIIYGSASGLNPYESDNHPEDQLIHRNSYEIKGEADSEARFGASLASGDYNKDGYSDLAIGVPGTKSKQGEINILYGSSGGIDPLESIDPDHIGDQLFSQDSPEVKGEAEGVGANSVLWQSEHHGGDRFGSSLAGAHGHGHASILRSADLVKEEKVPEETDIILTVYSKTDLTSAKYIFLTARDIDYTWDEIMIDVQERNLKLNEEPVTIRLVPTQIARLSGFLLIAEAVENIYVGNDFDLIAGGSQVLTFAWGYSTEKYVELRRNWRDEDRDGFEKCLLSRPGIVGDSPGTFMSADSLPTWQPSVLRAESDVGPLIPADRDPAVGGSGWCDCNDAIPQINAFSHERCGNGVDDNCNGFIDEENCFY